MKRSLFTTAIFTLLIYFTSNAQGWRNNTDIYFGQSNYHSDYHSDHYNNNYAYNGSGYYKKSKRHYTLSRRDKKKLYRLEKDLKRARRKAMHDGFITRREKRRINSIKHDIARLLNRNSHVHHNEQRYEKRSRGCR